MKSFRALLFVTTALIASPALSQEPAASPSSSASVAAQATNPLAAREEALAPVLSWMQSLGVKLTYLGDEGGLRGYLAEDANGKMQTIYVMPDREHVVAGLLLKRGGDNITGVQVGEMRARFAKAADQFVPKDGAPSGKSILPTATPQQSTDTAPKAETKDAADAEPEPAAASAVPAPASEQAAAELSADVSGPVDDAAVTNPIPEPVEKPTPAAEKAALALPEAKGPIVGAGGNPAELWISKSINKDLFIKRASEVPYFEVGSMQAPITVYEVADPKCPYCHAAWDYLRPLVYDKKIKVRVILIAALNGSEPLAREILSSAVPARRWIDSNAGKNLKIEMDPESQPWKDSLGYLDKNMDFAREFGVDRTPFLGYVGFDGQFYSALGLPSDLESFLSAAAAR